MVPPNQNRLVLTSVNQLIFLARNNPNLRDQVPVLEKLSTMDPSTSPKKSCNCGSKQNITTPDANKQVAESILSGLTTEDFVKVKNALNLNQLCYYKRNIELGKLELICV